MKNFYGLLPRFFRGLQEWARPNRKPAGNGARIVYEGYLSGYQYHQGIHMEHLFAHGASISLRHEPENPFDDDAVGVYYQNARIGFIPPHGTEEVAKLIRAGKTLSARITHFSPESEPWQRVYVEVLNLREGSFYQ